MYKWNKKSFSILAKELKAVMFLYLIVKKACLNEEFKGEYTRSLSEKDLPAEKIRIRSQISSVLEH